MDDFEAIFDRNGFILDQESGDYVRMQFLMTKKSHTNAASKGLESYSTKPYYLSLETLAGGRGGHQISVRSTYFL